MIGSRALEGTKRRRCSSTHVRVYSLAIDAFSFSLWFGLLGLCRLQGFLFFKGLSVDIGLEEKLISYLHIKKKFLLKKTHLYL